MHNQDADNNEQYTIDNPAFSGPGKAKEHRPPRKNEGENQGKAPQDIEQDKVCGKLRGDAQSGTGNNDDIAPFHQPVSLLQAFGVKFLL